MRGAWLLVVFGLCGACVIEVQERVLDGGTSRDVGRLPDLDPKCGNLQVDPGERCDIGLAAGTPGSCPTHCDDGLACTADTLSGGFCQAECITTPITACVSGDGCCPGGCDSATDDDCSKDCGNGRLDDKESCDTQIAAGQPGACPEGCDDGEACTKDTLLNAGTCAAQCSHVPITACVSGDGCCPSGCNALQDDDCSPSCGNGVVESGELCDKAIAAGKTGACPTSCSDGKACTKDSLLNGGSCSAQCSHSTIQQCKSGDGCCPAGCNANNDGDCSPVCGNGVVESGELCDGKCPTSCAAQTCKTGAVQGSGCQRKCAYSNASNGTSCSGGKCYGGTCCSGCWTGSSCVGGTTSSQCGSGGVTCDSCGSPKTCCATTRRCGNPCPV